MGNEGSSYQHKTQQDHILPEIIVHPSTPVIRDLVDSANLACRSEANVTYLSQQRLIGWSPVTWEESPSGFGKHSDWSVLTNLHHSYNTEGQIIVQMHYNETPYTWQYWYSSVSLSGRTRGSMRSKQRGIRTFKVIQHRGKNKMWLVQQLQQLRRTEKPNRNLSMSFTDRERSLYSSTKKLRSHTSSRPHCSAPSLVF